VKRGSQAPPQDDPGHDLNGGGVAARAEEGLGREGVGGIADGGPTDGDGRQARAVPYGRVRNDLNRAVRFAVPEGDRQGRPRRGRISETRGQGWEAWSDEARAPLLPWTARWRRLKQTGVEAQAGHNPSVATERVVARNSGAA